MTEFELRTLRALMERIVPPDFEGDPASGIAALPHLLRETAPGGAAPTFLQELLPFLARVNADAALIPARGPGEADVRRRGAPHDDFAALTLEEEDKLLSGYETDPVFRRLTEIVTEGFYVAPEGFALVRFAPVIEVTP